MLDVNRIHKIQGSLAALLASQAVLLGGCGEPTEIDEIDPIVDDGVVDEDDEEFRAWTGYTSEEYPPLSCPDQYAVQGADCTGGYCDNISLYCSYTGRFTSGQTWLPYFSEEGSGSADEGHCPGGDMWMTGVACNGGYCDNLSLLCARMSGSQTGYCAWSGWYSEEQAPFVAPWGYFLKGIECDGSYCDNKRYRYCWMY